MFSILIISFHSRHLLSELVKSIDKNIPIIIVENSLDHNLKNKLEQDHQNVRLFYAREIQQKQVLYLV